LNIPEFAKKPPVRGQVLSLPGYLEAAQTFHVRLKTIRSLQNPIRHAEQIKFHTGTIEEVGKIFLLEDEVLQEGKTGLATVVVNKPVGAAAYDRFIIRRLSPLSTLAGGEILAVSRAEKRPRKKRLVEQLNALLVCFKDIDPMTPEAVEKRVEYFLKMGRKRSFSPEDISKGTLLTEEVVKNSLSSLVEQDKVIVLGPSLHIHTETYRQLLSEMESRLEKIASEQGTLILSSSQLRQDFDWSIRLWKRIEEDLQSKGVLKKKGNRFILQAAVEMLGEDERRLMTKIQKVYAEMGYHSPRPDELAEMFRSSQEQINRILDYLFSQRKLIRLSKNVVLDYDSFKKAQDRVVEIIQEKGALDSADFKQYIGSSRKYALGILDFLDSKRITVRSGNIRKLTPDYLMNLL
jgi:selenocysteine-specific elongation factor